MFFVQTNLKGMLCVMFIILNILQNISFMSGSCTWNSSWRGNVPNESNHCIIGKQMESCELLQCY